MIKSNIIFFLFVLVLESCISPINDGFTKVPPGTWRGVLYLDENAIAPSADKDEVTSIQYHDGELPFNFEVKYDDADHFHVEIINSDERIVLKDIVYGRDKSTAKDTVKINFTDYDTYLYAIYEEGMLEGYWNVNYKDNYRIKFKAFHGDTSRFHNFSNAVPKDFSGRWATKFDVGQEGEYPAIGQFYQNGSRLTGTFATETGDYRYLEGIVVENKAWLSCFDGAHAFLFEAKMDDMQSITGQFRSGKNGVEAWQAVRDDKVTLTNPFELNKIDDKNKHVVVSLPNEMGKMIDSSQGLYQGKVKVIDIMGTWCPNCKDASNYLKEIKQKYENVEVIAVAFERLKENSDVSALLKAYKQKNELPFEITFGGYYNKKDAIKVFPQLDKIISYPTLLIIDKNNDIVKIFTGFYGPATSEYKAYTAEIESLIKSLL